MGVAVGVAVGGWAVTGVVGQEVIGVVGGLASTSAASTAVSGPNDDDVG